MFFVLQITDIVTRYLRCTFLNSVINVTVSPATYAYALPHITPSGSASFAWPSAVAPGASVNAAGLGVGVAFLVLALAVLVSLVVVRRTGSCCGVRVIFVPLATCGGLVPLHRKRIVSYWRGVNPLSSISTTGTTTPSHDHFSNHAPSMFSDASSKPSESAPSLSLRELRVSKLTA